jgi:hypothetical protein
MAQSSSTKRPCCCWVSPTKNGAEQTDQYVPYLRDKSVAVLANLKGLSLFVFSAFYTTKIRKMSPQETESQPVLVTGSSVNVNITFVMKTERAV